MSLVDDSTLILAIINKINIFEKTYGKLFEDKEVLKEESEAVFKDLKILIDEIIDDLVS